MHSESRRNFVKKSLATSVTISFAGLIRAHGQEGGGTTWSPNQSTYSSTNGGGTTTWNPNQGTTYFPNSTTWNPSQNTTSATDSTTWNPEETTFETTTKPKKPALYKKDPPEAGILSESKSLSNSNAMMGIVIVTEDKGGGVLDTKFKGELKWKLSYKMNIPKGEKQTNGATPVPKKKECLLCNLSDVELTIIVTRTEGAHNYLTPITGAIGGILDNLNNGVEGVVKGSGCKNGLSVTAIDENGVAKVDSIAFPDEVKSDDESDVIMVLDVDVDPGLTASPTQVVTFEAKFEKLKGFNEANFNAAAKLAIEQAVIQHNNQHRATTLTFPKISELTDHDPLKRTQEATAAMTDKEISDGEHCDL